MWEWTFNGLGRHIEVIPFHELEKGLKLLYYGFSVHNAASSIPRLSVLLFYLRVFGRKWKYGLPLIHITIWLNIFQMIAISLVNFLKCIPVRKSWDVLIPGHCIDTYEFYLGSSIIAMVLDVMVLVLPLPMLWTLQLKPVQKFLMIGLFICGYM